MENLQLTINQIDAINHNRACVVVIETPFAMTFGQNVTPRAWNLIKHFGDDLVVMVLPKRAANEVWSQALIINEHIINNITIV